MSSWKVGDSHSPALQSLQDLDWRGCGGPTAQGPTFLGRPHSCSSLRSCTPGSGAWVSAFPGLASILFGPVWEPSLLSLAPSELLTSFCVPGVCSNPLFMNLGFHGRQEEGALQNLQFPTCYTNLPEPRGHPGLGSLLRRGGSLQERGEYAENETQTPIKCQ